MFGSFFKKAGDLIYGDLSKAQFAVTMIPPLSIAFVTSMGFYGSAEDGFIPAQSMPITAVVYLTVWAAAVTTVNAQSRRSAHAGYESLGTETTVANLHDGGAVNEHMPIAPGWAKYIVDTPPDKEESKYFFY